MILIKVRSKQSLYFVKKNLLTVFLAMNKCWRVQFFALPFSFNGRSLDYKIEVAIQTLIMHRVSAWRNVHTPMKVDGQNCGVACVGAKCMSDVIAILGKHIGGLHKSSKHHVVSFLIQRRRFHWFVFPTNDTFKAIKKDLLENASKNT